MKYKKRMVGQNSLTGQANIPSWKRISNWPAVVFEGAHFENEKLNCQHLNVNAFIHMRRSQFASSS